MIKMQVIGHIGKDAVVNNVNGKTVINFSVAHSEKFKDAQGNQKDKTIWVDCAYWTDRTAVAPYIKKGGQVYVEGSADIRTYTTQDGKTGSTMIMRVANIQLLGGKEAGTSGGQYSAVNEATARNYTPNNEQPPQQQNVSEITEPVDDLPF